MNLPLQWSALSLLADTAEVCGPVTWPATNTETRSYVALQLLLRLCKSRPHFASPFSMTAKFTMLAVRAHMQSRCVFFRRTGECDPRVADQTLQAAMGQRRQRAHAHMSGHK